MVGVVVGVGACGDGGLVGERPGGREGFNQIARDATARLYAALDQMPDDLEIEEARQYWNDCGGVDDGRFFAVEVDFVEYPGLGEVVLDELAPWAREQGWSTRRDIDGERYFVAFDDPETGWIVGSTVNPEGGTYDLGVSAGCYEAYDGHRSENVRLPDDLTEFVRQRRPVEQLPVLDPDRGPIEVQTDGPAPTMESVP